MHLGDSAHAFVQQCTKYFWAAVYKMHLGGSVQNVFG